MNTQFRTAALPALLIIGLSATFAIELQAPAAAPAGTIETVAAETTADGTDGLSFKPAAADGSREIIERPLFFASRRPLPPEPPQVAEAKPEPEPPLNFALIGTILTDNSRVALVKPEKLPVQEIALGQVVDGWTVSSIDDDRMMVRHGTTIQLVGLRDFNAAKALPASMRPAAAAAARPPAPTAPRPPAPAAAAAPAAQGNPARQPGGRR